MRHSSHQPRPGLMGQTRPRLPGVRPLVLGLLALGAAATAEAGESCVENTPALTVQAQAVVEQTATTIDLSAVYRAEGEAAAAATERLEGRVGPLLETLREATEDEAPALRAEALRVVPRWERRAPEKTTRRQIAAYIATRRVSLEGVDIAEAGEWVRRLNAADPHRLDLRNPQADLDEGPSHPALSAAVEKARAKAEVMAEALGQSVGAALCVHEQSDSPGAVRPLGVQHDGAMMTRDGASEPDLEPGQITHHARVEVVFALNANRD